MTKQETLTKAIEKAIANGWRATLKDGSLNYQTMNDNYYDTAPAGAIGMLYEHDFLKAFFGEETKRAEEIWQEVQTLDYTPLDLAQKQSLPENKDWQHHAQQMVISEDPIGYLGKFVEPTLDDLWDEHEAWLKLQHIYKEVKELRRDSHTYRMSERLYKAQEDLSNLLYENLGHRSPPLFPRGSDKSS